MSSQTLNPQKHDQNTMSQAREKAETHRERESRDLRDKKENKNVPKQQIDRFNRRKFQRKQKKRNKPEEEKYGMKLEMTPNLEESNVKKEQVLQAEDSFNPNNDQKLQTGENLLVRWEELKKSNEVPPPETSLKKYVMKLEMTPNLEESNIRKEQVLQVEDSFNPNNDQKLEMLQKEVEKVLERAVPKIHQENRKV